MYAKHPRTRPTPGQRCADWFSSLLLMKSAGRAKVKTEDHSRSYGIIRVSTENSCCQLFICTIPPRNLGARAFEDRVTDRNKKGKDLMNCCALEIVQYTSGVVSRIIRYAMFNKSRCSKQYQHEILLAVWLSGNPSAKLLLGDLFCLLLVFDYRLHTKRRTWGFGESKFSRTVGF